MGSIDKSVGVAHSLAMRDLARTTVHLAGRGEQGSQRMTDMGSGTCAVPNLGSFSVEALTPITHRPQVTIPLGLDLGLDLGLGLDRASPSTLSLKIDHRAADGVPGVRSLSEIASLLEDPACELYETATGKRYTVRFADPVVRTELEDHRV